MCRLFLAEGVVPEKVWIYGNLRTPTVNHPRCLVTWGWHVAPTLLVDLGANREARVIDPSLFSLPVAKAEWKRVQGDPAATLESSPAEVFYRSRGGAYVEYDGNYAKTQSVLSTYRNRLKLRSAEADGPPPYFACMPKPAGTQWVGMIGGRATQHWFTWGWPPQWHVVWNIMPVTACPGGPQLTWSVQVERANATQCTYWITVVNLTSDPVKFEGRYDILKT
jgi:hypothetical protein